MKPTLVVLAAGMGSRYGSLKQIDKFGPNGETIIDYSVYDAINAGFGKIIFVIRKNIEKEFKEVFSNKYREKIPIEYVFQELDKLPEGFKVPKKRLKPWGTAHAVLMVKGIVHEPFAIINGDDFYGQHSFKTACNQLSQMNPEDLNGFLVGYILKNTLSDNGKVSRGICIVNNNMDLQKITERTDIYKKQCGGAFYMENEKKFDLSGNEIVSMNLMGFSPKVLELIEREFVKFLEEKGHENKSEFFIPSILEKMLKICVRIPVLLTQDEWFGVTYKEDKITAGNCLNKLIETGQYPGKLW